LTEALSDIFTINIDGSDRTNITNTPDRREFGPSWQPVFDTTPPEISSTDPPKFATGVAATDNITATFIEEDSGINESTLRTGFKVEQVKPKGNVQVQGNVTYTSPTATFDPSSNLAKGLYRVTLTGVADNAGNVMPNYTWTFTTAGPPKR
jgi:hypothetical protein